MTIGELREVLVRIPPALDRVDVMDLYEEGAQYVLYKDTPVVRDMILVSRRYAGAVWVPRHWDEAKKGLAEKQALCLHNVGHR